jgi:hypothetical protein
MYCTVKKLDALFNEARNEHPIEILINAADDSSSSEINGILISTH